MKKIIIAFTISVSILMTACGNEQQSNNDGASQNNQEENNDASVNLFNQQDIEEGYWMGQSGELSENEDYILSNPIEYDPSNQYTISDTAYVSYYSEEEFIQTILYNEAPPNEVEQVENADNIRISFSKNKLDNFSLTNEN